MVYKLSKALYGLKQTPRAWFSRIESYFIKEGFERSSSEHTLFIKRKKGWSDSRLYYPTKRLIKYGISYVFVVLLLP